MNISVPSNAPLGNYTLTITANCGGVVQNVLVVLTVTATDLPSFTLSVPGTASATAGGQTNPTIQTTVTNGFNNAVSLSAKWRTQWDERQLQPEHHSGPGLRQLDYGCQRSCRRRLWSYPITVNATSSQGNQTATVTLTVSASGSVIFLPVRVGITRWRTQFPRCQPGTHHYNPDPAPWMPSTSSGTRNRRDGDLGRRRSRYNQRAVFPLDIRPQ